MEEQKEEKKTGAVQYVMVVLTGVFMGFCLLFGITLSMQTALNPVREDIRALTQAQIRMEQKIDGAVRDMGSSLQTLLTEVVILQTTVKEIRKMKMPSAALNGDSRFNQQPTVDLSKVYDLPVESSYILGDPKAPVTIVEFSDMQCPYCARFHPGVKEVVAAYPGQVKVIFKHYPLGFHKMARPAVKAALAAGVQGKFYEMVEKLMANNTSLSAEKFEELAQELKLNVVQFKKDLKEGDAKWEKVIAEDVALAEKSGVRGTPTYFLNGKISNARTLNQWKAEIDAFLKK